MSKTRMVYRPTLVILLLSAALATAARADGDKFSTLHQFQPEAVNTYASPLGSEPDRRLSMSVK